MAELVRILMLKNKKIFILICITFFGALGIFGIYTKIFASKECQTLDEQACQVRTDCAAIYSTEFYKCVVISEEQKKILDEDRALCENTGGQSQETKFGAYCNCAVSYPTMIFVFDQGCVTK